MQEGRPQAFFHGFGKADPCGNAFRLHTNYRDFSRTFVQQRSRGQQLSCICFMSSGGTGAAGCHFTRRQHMYGAWLGGPIDGIQYQYARTPADLPQKHQALSAPVHKLNFISPLPGF